MRPGAGRRLCVQVISDKEKAVGLVARMEREREEARHLPHQDLSGQVEKQLFCGRGNIGNHPDSSALLDNKKAVRLSSRSTNGNRIIEQQSAQAGWVLYPKL